MNKLIKKIGVLVTSVFLILSITSVSSFAAEKTILFSIKGPGSGNAFWASVEQGAKDEAKKLGVKLVLIAPPQEGDVQSQINQVEDQLAKGVDAMAIAPADPNAFAPIVDDAIRTSLTPNFLASSLAPFSTEAQKGFPDPGPLILNNIVFWAAKELTEVMLNIKTKDVINTPIFLINLFILLFLYLYL